MTQDQVFVPPTRSDVGLKPFDCAKEDLLGSRVTEEVKREMWEALGDSPIGAMLGAGSYLVSNSVIFRCCFSFKCSISSAVGGCT